MVKTYKPKAEPVPGPEVQQQGVVVYRTRRQASLEKPIGASDTETQLVQETSSSTKRKKVKAKAKGRGKEEEEDDGDDKMAVDSVEQSAPLISNKKKKRPVKDEDYEEDELPEEQSSKGEQKPKKKRAKKEVVEDDDDKDEDDLYKLTIPQLKERLRAIGLSPGGAKSVLVSRLQGGLPVFTIPVGLAVTYEWDDPKAKEWKIENSRTSRADCCRCREKIEQGMLRLSFSTYKFEYNAYVDRWYHSECFGAYPPQGMTTVEDFDELRFARGFNDPTLIAKMRANFAPLVSDDDKITDDSLSGEKEQRRRIRGISGCTEAKAAEMDKLVKARGMHPSSMTDDGLREFLTEELDAKFWHSLSAGAAHDLGGGGGQIEA